MGRNTGAGCAAGDPRVQCGVRLVFVDLCSAFTYAHAVEWERWGIKWGTENGKISFWGGERLILQEGV